MNTATHDQFDWEARWAKPAAAAAFASTLSLGASTVGRYMVLDGDADDEQKVLVAIDDRHGLLVASSLLQALSFIALAGVLFYLAHAVLARKPKLPQALVWLGVIGPVLLAIAGSLTDIHRIDAANRFLASGAQTVERANGLLEGGAVFATVIGSAGTLAVVIAFVLFSINAMQVGLLTRFMGIIGAVIGVLYAIPLLAGPVIQMTWLIAVGILFLGYWPGGRGVAWETEPAVAS